MTLQHQFMKERISWIFSVFQKREQSSTDEKYASENVMASITVFNVIGIIESKLIFILFRCQFQRRGDSSMATSDLRIVLGFELDFKVENKTFLSLSISDPHNSKDTNCFSQELSSSGRRLYH
ncbi:CLUMA_CG001091, isoform A [Clunio marinus]|uniref:CLUMA_CG001091, isoform A n=1 Tax=Clunio marinus TaxID=568069 RepID=A0A1J1HM37_9DIPT|nr:CLUMA_CG001091, isoform A [Clunio marinus]